MGAPFWITAFPPSMPSVLLSHLLLCHSRCSLGNHRQWMAELNSSFLGSTSSNRFSFPLKNLSPNLISSLAIKLAIKIANNSVSGFTVHCATLGRTGFAFSKIFKCHSQRSWKRPLPVTFYCVSVCVVLEHTNTHTFRGNCVFPMQILDLRLYEICACSSLVLYFIFSASLCCHPISPAVIGSHN